MKLNFRQIKKSLKNTLSSAESVPGYFVADYTFAQLAYFLTAGTIIPKLTAYYNLPLAFSNLVVALPSALGSVELLGGYFFNNSDNQHRYIKIVSMAWRILIPMVLLSAVFPVSIGGTLMVLAYFLMCTMVHMTNPGYNAWMVSSIKGLVKADYYSRRDMVFIPLLTLGSLLSGLLIKQTEASGNLRGGIIIFGLAVLAFSLLSMPYVLKLLPSPKKSVSSRKLSLTECIKMPLKDKRYRKVLIFQLMWNFAFPFWTCFAGVYQIRVLNLDYFYITVCSTIASIARIAFIPVFSKFADRRSWKSATLLSMTGIIGDCFLWIFINKYNYQILFPFATIIGTIPWAALGIGFFKFQITYTDENTRSIYFSINSMLCGLVSAAAGILSSLLTGIIEGLPIEEPPYWIIFLIGCICTVITAVMVWITPYKEPD
jgi:hypothetical protein